VDVLGVAARAINDPALLKQLLISPDVSKDGRAHWPAYGDVIQRWPLSLWVAVDNMFTAYGSNHRRLRRLVAPAFTARRVSALTSTVESIVVDVVDALEDLPADTIVDLRQHLAYPVPITVIGHLIGVPTGQLDGFRAIVDGVFDTTLTRSESEDNNRALFGIMSKLIADKRNAPGDDLISHLISARDSDGDGSGLTEQELLGTLVLILSAGYETTVNLIDQAISLLLVHPEQREYIQIGRATWGDVVEETLRLEPAVTHVPMRYAVNPIELPTGEVIERGEALLASLGAANVHPSWHGETARHFDITRPDKEHLAFGHGVHRCLGASLARLEVTTVLRELFDRFPSIELAVPAPALKPLHSLISNGHESLPVRLRSVTRKGKLPSSRKQYDPEFARALPSDRRR
jgi:cytochrome P450